MATCKMCDKEALVGKVYCRSCIHGGTGRMHERTVGTTKRKKDSVGDKSEETTEDFFSEEKARYLDDLKED